nr:MAG TPA: hypothetical protein [Caudoviricetes sp.]
MFHSRYKFSMYFCHLCTELCFTKSVLTKFKQKKERTYSEFHCIHDRSVSSCRSYSLIIGFVNFANYSSNLYL